MGVWLSEALLGLTRGIEGFIEGMSSFVSNFATEQHKFTVAQEALTSAFDQAGLKIPPSRDAMFALMQSLDATTESGREQIATRTIRCRESMEYSGHLGRPFGLSVVSRRSGPSMPGRGWAWFPRGPDRPRRRDKMQSVAAGTIGQQLAGRGQ
ncbi:MAG: hypothetical protein J0L88_02320 [Xanthomonadales bacterium]|nr:hypothetical protein [Xanthomonadales bacterium]